jgi:hypothetical protein
MMPAKRCMTHSVPRVSLGFERIEEIQVWEPGSWIGPSISSSNLLAQSKLIPGRMPVSNALTLNFLAGFFWLRASRPVRKTWLTACLKETPDRAASTRSLVAKSSSKVSVVRTS